jgi:hypothetical protein
LLICLATLLLAIVALLHSLSHLVVTPCYSCLAPCCFHSYTLLLSFSHLVVLAPCCSHFRALLLSLSHHVIFTPCYSHMLFVPCYSHPHALLLSLSRLAIHALLFSFLYPTAIFQVLPSPPIVALLPCYSLLRLATLPC